MPSRTRIARSSAGRRRRIATKVAGTPALPRAPRRTCVACRTERAKRDLVRVVRAPGETLSVDLRGKAPGRGAYVCPDPACLERGLADGAIGRALEVAIDADAAARLRAEIEGSGRMRKS